MIASFHTNAEMAVILVEGHKVHGCHIRLSWFDRRESCELSATDSVVELGPTVCGLSRYGRQRGKVVPDRDDEFAKGDMCRRRKCKLLEVFEA